ncbi:MAG: HIT family protein [Actinomycetota bacterium]
MKGSLDRTLAPNRRCAAGKEDPIAEQPCIFCAIARGSIPANVVYEDDTTFAFLDHRPVFFGHTLVAPRAHIETLGDLPDDLIAGFFGGVRVVARAVEEGMSADGTFVAINNKISQSVPHLHTHVVPRRRKDGLRGFFWPRQKYRDDEHIREVAEAIAGAAARAR